MYDQRKSLVHDNDNKQEAAQIQRMSDTLRQMASIALFFSWWGFVVWILAYGYMFGMSVYYDGFVGWTLLIVFASVLAVWWMLLQWVDRPHVSTPALRT